MTSNSVLPDDVLLLIFGYFADEEQFTKKEIEAWQSLAHVCRQWRCVVFSFARLLNLRLVCTPRTSTRDMLDVWPGVPLLIQGEDFDTSGMNNIISALERNHVRKINLAGVSSLQLEKISAAMRKPIPELMHLELWSHDETVPVLPNSLLGGSAPSLRFLWLARIPFPGLPKLLLSATHLVDLHLSEIPRSGYIIPEAMATTISSLTSLESLSLKFQSPRSLPVNRLIPENPDWRSRRYVLPVLTYFWFKGESEYLDNLVDHIETPQLMCLDITFFNDIEFDTPNLTQFVTRIPTLNIPEKARVSFEKGAARVNLSSHTSDYGALIVGISCSMSDWQVSALEQVCTSCIPLFTKLEDLSIFENPYSQPDWQVNFEDEPLAGDEQWLELFNPFSNVKNLYLSEAFAPRIMLSLQRLQNQTAVGSNQLIVRSRKPAGGKTIEREFFLLPALQNVFLEGLQPSGPVQKATGQFVAARELTGHPVTVSRWDRRSGRSGF